MKPENSNQIRGRFAGAEQFVIDTFARRIVGWRASRTAHASFVLDALEQGPARPAPCKGEQARAPLRSRIAVPATPSALRKRASSRPSAASGTRTTMRSPKA